MVAREREEAELEAAPSADACSAAASSSSAAAPTPAPGAGFDMDVVCASLGLSVKDEGRVWRFADAGNPDKVILDVHTVGRVGGALSLKATCKRGHGRCMCWISRSCDGAERFGVLHDLMRWGAEGRSKTENEHFADATRLKRSYGMKIR